jgi:transcriptional regulator with XRE-family HTH domain
MRLEFYQALGLRIRDKREALKLSREKFSELSDVSPQFLADVEAGRKGISALTLYKICTTLDVSADNLLTGVTSGDFSSVSNMLSMLNATQLTQAKDLLRLFIKALKTNETKK